MELSAMWLPISLRLLYARVVLEVLLRMRAGAIARSTRQGLRLGSRDGSWPGFLHGQFSFHKVSRSGISKDHPGYPRGIRSGRLDFCKRDLGNLWGLCQTPSGAPGMPYFQFFGESQTSTLKEQLV